MERMNLKQIQGESLMILKDVHDFCTANHIRYSLAYGSLIGAIRHQGFIPWDDDIDIMMPRPDYEKFCHSYSSNKYELVSSYNHHSYLAFSRVCEMSKTHAECFVPWCDIQTGIWIDIFPLDGAEVIKKNFNNRYKRANLLWRLIYLERGAKCRFSKTLSIAQTCKLAAKKILFINGILLKSHLKNFNILIQQYSWERNGKWCQMSCCDNGDNEYNLASDFNDIIMTPFENYYFCIIKTYDKVLRSQYGNYMEMPPENKRKPKLSENSFFYKT